jgi:cysteine synthase A
VVEASSGSTAISEAYFARLLGLPFLAVMPSSTSTEKIAAIEFQGGRCHLIDDPMTIYSESQRLADELGGHYVDQFTYAERAALVASLDSGQLPGELPARWQIAGELVAT